MKEFTQYENELLTKCWDEKDKFKVNINPETDDISAVDNTTNKVIWNFGKSNGLIEKMLRYCDINPSFEIT